MLVKLGTPFRAILDPKIASCIHGTWHDQRSMTKRGPQSRMCVHFFYVSSNLELHVCLFFELPWTKQLTFFCGLSTELFQTKKNNFLDHETQQIEPSFFLSRELQELAKVNYFPKWFSNQKPHFLTKQNFLNEHL